MIKKFINVPRNISFNIQCAKKCLLTIILIFSFFQFIYLRFEYPFIQIDWSLHHDEKGTIPDARYYFLKDAKQIDILDYKPHSASAFFGVAGPAIESLGFKIFGMNNVGLRVFFVIITTVTTALFVFLILKITPGMSGLFFSILYVFNFTNFILHRHAILENFLTFFLICILWLYITRPSLLLNNLYKICFVAGTSVLFKPTFAFYVYLLLFLITIVEFKNLRKIMRFVLWSFFSILFFESIQFFILSKMGIAHHRYQSIPLIFLQQKGVSLEKVWGITQVAHFYPVGLKIFARFPIMIAGWYGIPKAIFYIYNFIELIIGYLFASMLIYMIFLGIKRIIAKEGFIISLFIAIYLLSSAPFFYYTKRAVSFFPFAIILFALFSHRLMEYFFKKLPQAYKMAKFFLLLIATVYSIFQIATLVQISTKKTEQVERNSIALDNDLPKGSVVYTHCYGYRFFWQAKEQRLFSGDDVFLTNPMIFAWALKNHGRYIMLSGRSDALNLQSYKSSSNWFVTNVALQLELLDVLTSDFSSPINLDTSLISEALHKVKALNIIKVYTTSETESDKADHYTLMEIVYN